MAKKLSSQQISAQTFLEVWKDRGFENRETQKFWIDLLQSVFQVKDAVHYIEFEKPVKLSNASRIDGYIATTKVLIEQKGKDIDLDKKERQSDGEELTPYEQAKRYNDNLPYSEKVRWIVTCNFQTFHIYNMEDKEPVKTREVLNLKDFGKEYYRLNFLVDENDQHTKREMEVSIAAGDIVGEIYEKFLAQYKNPESPETLKSLNVLCVRIVFCLYAEDAGLFGRHGMFHDYLAQFNAPQMRRALIELFNILNQKIEERDEYLKDENPTLAAFPYVNGGLFAKPKGDADIEIPMITDEIRDLLLAKASDDFDWSEISPTIFGAVFESTLNPETRRKGGMHYTSIENIHKVIDPLFLDDLKAELASILEKVNPEKELRNFQAKLSHLTFLDPACGSGNFLTETYLCLRRLENKVLSTLSKGQMEIAYDVSSPIQVQIQQFYGIEINDFAVTVAKTALWIAESQMMKETESIIHSAIDFLPLKTNAHIVEGNALKTDWQTFENSAEVMSGTFFEKESHEKRNYDYIIGNPPFVGARLMNAEQKQDLENVFGKDWKNAGNLDYVACWYKKAADLMKGSNTRTALVSTNSICQGESVANLWKPLFDDGVHIDFAHRTFRWDSEASIKAHVHCVIVGFSSDENKKPKRIFAGDECIDAKNINGYLIDAENFFIEKRMKPLCNVPEIYLGGQAIDDGNFVLTEDEKNELLKKEPQTKKFIRRYMMGKDFIDRKPRFCLWLKDANPSLLRECPTILNRISKVKEFRLKSVRVNTLKAAENPALFGQPFECQTDYIAIPKVSSERRKYIPMDYLSSDIIPGDKLFTMQNATLYHFGVLTSSVHMAWMRAVCGRLKSDYSYSNTIVYNNFIWPEVRGQGLGGSDQGVGGSGQGAGAQFDQGISAISVNSQRVDMRVGNTTDYLQQNQLLDSGANCSSRGNVAGNRQNAKCTHEKTSSGKKLTTDYYSLITKTAQAILDARAKYPDSSLADLYDELTMPVELRRAHQENDRAVIAAYGFKKTITESEIVAELMNKIKQRG